MKKTDYRMHFGIPLLLAVVTFFVFELTQLDFYLLDPFYDFQHRLWRWGDNWWVKIFLHKRGRDLIAAIGGFSFLLAIGGCLVSRLRPYRRRLLYIVLCIALGSGGVALMKHYSLRPCPWSLSRYGGILPYVNLLEAYPENYPQGKCFPGGHASGAFSLFGLYFLWHKRNQRWARVGFWSAMLLGFVFSFGRMAQGAHFASHNIWSALYCWVVAACLYYIMLENKENKKESEVL